MREIGDYAGDSRYPFKGEFLNFLRSRLRVCRKTLRQHAAVASRDVGSGTGLADRLKSSNAKSFPPKSEDVFLRVRVFVAVGPELKENA